MRMKSLAPALAIFVMTGCVVGEDMPTPDDLPPPQSEAAYANNPHTAFNFFVAKGLTEIQAAGIVGNLMQESSVLPTAVELGGGPGRGIAQWSIGGRWNRGSDSAASFAAARGADRWALQTQLDFVWYELSVVGGYGLSSLESASTLSQAVTAFQNSYERCGACAQGKRLTYAQQVLADYGGSGGTGSDPGPGCYSGTLDRDVPENTCLQSKYDGQWYQCSDGQWVDRWSDPDPCNGTYPL
jgi:tail lysozyme